MRIQLISKENGLGLSHDMQVLRSALVGISGASMQVTSTDWQAKPSAPGTFDVNIFLELLNPAHYRSAKRNILVPNPEWFVREWRQHLSGLTQVWAKTRDCERIFQGLHRDVKYTGWSSFDMHDPTVERRKALLHVAGGSSAKGTAAVLEAMRMLPDLALTMISSRPIASPPENVTVLGRQDAAELKRLMNEHAVHVCPSSYEGFGHYINEARSVGAVIISTAAAPMDELVGGEYGLLAGVASRGWQNLATHSHVDPEALAKCMQSAMACPLPLLVELGAHAREQYLADGKAFENNLIGLLK
jgi:glycosyltransferase involved in cell wall biosynthesis